MVAGATTGGKSRQSFAARCATAWLRSGGTAHFSTTTCTATTCTFTHYLPTYPAPHTTRTRHAHYTTLFLHRTCHCLHWLSVSRWRLGGRSMGNLKLLEDEEKWARGAGDVDIVAQHALYHTATYPTAHALRRDGVKEHRTRWLPSSVNQYRDVYRNAFSHDDQWRHARRILKWRASLGGGACDDGGKRHRHHAAHFTPTTALTPHPSSYHHRTTLRLPALPYLHVLTRTRKHARVLVLHRCNCGQTCTRLCPPANAAFRITNTPNIFYSNDVRPACPPTGNLPVACLHAHLFYLVVGRTYAKATSLPSPLAVADRLGRNPLPH